MTELYGYSYIVPGELWMALFADSPERIQELKDMCIARYYAGLKGPSTEPIVDISFDEKHRWVRVWVQGISVETPPD